MNTKAQKVLDPPHIWDRQKADFNTIPPKVKESLPRNKTEMKRKGKVTSIPYVGVLFI